MIRAEALTLSAAIAACAAARPDGAAITILAGESDIQTLTYARLHAEALAAAARLAAAGIRPGDVVVLAGEHNTRLVLMFLAAIYCGGVPAIAPYANVFREAERYQQRLAEIIRESQARAVILLAASSQELAGQLTGLNCLVLDGFSLAGGADSRPAPDPNFGIPEPAPTDRAYIQFSSGTTGAPKGAAVTHAAVLHHLRVLSGVFNLAEDDVLAGWVPFYHDLGLVVYLLLPLVSGVPALCMAPDYWVRRPHVLLRLIHQHRGTICIMPNFGFAHIARHVHQRDLEGLDLSCVRHMVAGAEVVQPDTLQAFGQRLRLSGLAPEVLQVGYGMTECVFMASLSPNVDPLPIDRIDRQELLNNRRAVPGPANALPIISCGSPLPGTVIAILDEQGAPLPERGIGEVVIATPALFEGYLNRPDLTAAALREGRLHTGDLGYLAGGQLFIVDRKKDLIIVAGKHIYPETLEQAGLGVVGEAAGRAAAFGVRSPELGTELPVLVCEVRGQMDANQEAQLAAQIRRQVQQVAEVALADVRLVRRGWLETTTSGKVARSATREKYLAAGYAPEPPGLEMLQALGANLEQWQAALAALAGRMLGVAAVQPEDSFFELGGDSLTVMRYILAVEGAVGRSVPVEFFRQPTAANLARLLAEPQRDLLDPVPGSSDPNPADPNFPGPGLFSKQVFRLQKIPQWLRIRLRTQIESLALRRPYFAGMKWLLGWAGKRWVQALLYPQESELVRRFARSVGADELQVAQQVQLSLASRVFRRRNLWGAEKLAQRGTKKSAFMKEIMKAATSAFQGALWQRYFVVRGASYLEEGLKRGHGVILVGSHTHTYLVLRSYIRQFDVGYLTIGIVLYRKMFKILNPDAELSAREGWDEARTAAALKGHQALERGSIVVIANDADDPIEGQRVVIGDRVHHLQAGFAELAVASSAVVLPFHTLLLPDGRMEVVFLAPLNWDHTLSPAGQVEQLVKTNAAILAEVRRQHPGSLSWELMQRHLACPEVRAE